MELHRNKRAESNSLPVVHVREESHTAHQLQLFSVDNHPTAAFQPQKYNSSDKQLFKTSPCLSFQHLLFMQRK